MSTETSNECFMPPPPPENIKVSMEQNRFEYILDNHMRKMMINGFQAVTRTETWEFVKEDPGKGGFMYSSKSKNRNHL